MPAFRNTVDISATPEEVWKVLGDINSVTRWIPGVASATAEGMSRVCTFDDGHVQTEQILDYSTDSRSYRYVIEGAPLPVTHNTGLFAVEPTGSQARVVWESSFRAVDPAMEDDLAQMWEPYLPLVLANLKRLVEGA